MHVGDELVEHREGRHCPEGNKSFRAATPRCLPRGTFMFTRVL